MIVASENFQGKLLKNTSSQILKFLAGMLVYYLLFSG